MKLLSVKRKTFVRVVQASLKMAYLYFIVLTPRMQNQYFKSSADQSCPLFLQSSPPAGLGIKVHYSGQISY